MGLVPGFGSYVQGGNMHRPLHSRIQIDGRSGKCRAVGGWAGPLVSMGQVGDWHVVIRLGEHDVDPANLQAQLAGMDPVALVPEELDAGDLVGILDWDPDETDDSGLVSPRGELRLGSGMEIHLAGFPNQLTLEIFVHQNQIAPIPRNAQIVPIPRNALIAQFPQMARKTSCLRRLRRCQSMDPQASGSHASQILTIRTGRVHGWFIPSGVDFKYVLLNGSKTRYQKQRCTPEKPTPGGHRNYSTTRIACTYMVLSKAISKECGI